MKTFLMGTAIAVASLTAAPAFAAVVGSVGIAGARTEVESLGPDVEAEAYGVSAGLAVPLNDSLSLAFNGSAVEPENGDTVFSGTVHLSDDLDGAGRIGGFAGVTSVNDERLWAVGMEGDAYLGPVTVGASAAFGSVDDADADFRSFQARGRFFPLDNLRLDGGFGRVLGDVAGTEIDIWTANLGGEFQFGDGPVSLFGGYSYADVQEVAVTGHTVSLGVRFSFGGGLKERDTSGADLGGIEDLAGALVF